MISKTKLLLLIACLLTCAAGLGAQPADSANVRMLGSIALPVNSLPATVAWTDYGAIVSRFSTSDGNLLYDVSNPRRIQLRWQESPRGYRRETQSALYENGYLYEAGLTLGRMSRVTATGLQLIDSVNGNGFAVSLAKHGDSIYFGNLEAGIMLACDSAHTRLRLQSQEPDVWLPTAYCALAWQNPYLFALDLDFGLKVFGLSDPVHPNMIGSLALPDDPFDLQIRGDRIYVADDQAGILVIDISNPQSPTLISQFGEGGRAQGLALTGTHLFAADHEQGLRVYSLADPDNPAEVGRWNGGRGLRCLAVADSVVYACDTRYFVTLNCAQALPAAGSRSPVPSHYDLLSSYPNPFNGATVLRYHLADPSGAALTIFDVLGRMVWSYPLPQHGSGSGTVVWPGTVQDGSGAASGTYFCRLSARHESKTITLQLLR